MISKKEFLKEGSDTLSLRHNIKGEIGEMSIDDFEERILDEIESKVAYTE